MGSKIHLVPRFAHDCKDCVFLGTFNGEDLYFHPNPPNLISRGNNSKTEYTCGILLWEVEPQLTEAARRALTFGLVTQEYLTNHSLLHQEEQ